MRVFVLLISFLLISPTVVQACMMPYIFKMLCREDAVQETPYRRIGDHHFRIPTVYMPQNQRPLRDGSLEERLIKYNQRIGTELHVSYKTLEPICAIAEKMELEAPNLYAYYPFYNINVIYNSCQYEPKPAPFTKEFAGDAMAISLNSDTGWVPFWAYGEKKNVYCPPYKEERSAFCLINFVYKENIFISAYIYRHNIEFKKGGIVLIQPQIDKISAFLDRFHVDPNDKDLKTYIAKSKQELTKAIETEKYRNILETAISYGRYDLAEQYLKEGVAYDEQKILRLVLGKNGRSTKISFKEKEAFFKLLVKYGLDLNSKKNTELILYNALARWPNASLLESAVKAGLDPDFLFVDTTNRILSKEERAALKPAFKTSLFRLGWFDKISKIDILLNAGVNPYARDRKGNSFLAYIAEPEKTAVKTYLIEKGIKLERLRNKKENLPKFRNYHGEYISEPGAITLFE